MKKEMCVACDKKPEKNTDFPGEKSQKSNKQGGWNKDVPVRKKLEI